MVVEDRSRIRDVFHVKDRLHVAICEPVEVDDDGGIFGRQRVNTTERIVVRWTSLAYRLRALLMARDYSQVELYIIYSASLIVIVIFMLYLFINKCSI